MRCKTRSGVVVFQEFYTRYRLKAWLLLALFVAYLFLGAMAFQLFEGPEQKSKSWLESERLKKLRNEFASNLSINLLNTTDLLLFVDSERSDLILDLIRVALQDYETYIGFEEGKDEYIWTFWNSTAYALSLATTVGHSGLAPRTLAGQVFGLIYALFGVLVLLALINDWSNLFQLGLECFWSRICCFPRTAPMDVVDLHLQKRHLFGKLMCVVCLIIAWLLCCSFVVCVLNEVNTRDAADPLWDSVFHVFLGFFTIDVVSPRRVEDQHGQSLSVLCMLGSVPVALILISVAVRLLALLTGSTDDMRQSFHFFNRSVTFSSGVTGACTMVRDRMATHSPMLEVGRTFPVPGHRYQIQVDEQGMGHLVAVPSDYVSGYSLDPPDAIMTESYPSIRDDERAWLAEIGRYDESEMTRSDLAESYFEKVPHPHTPRKSSTAAAHLEHPPRKASETRKVSESRKVSGPYFERALHPSSSS